MDICGTNDRSNGDAGFCRHGRQDLQVESLLSLQKDTDQFLPSLDQIFQITVPSCPLSKLLLTVNVTKKQNSNLKEPTPLLLVRLSVCFAPSSNEMVSLKSKESADGEAAGGPWRARDILSFVWRTHQKRDVANGSQTCPVMFFAENWHRTCWVEDEALG
jgi:hypothetical protein